MNWFRDLLEADNSPRNWLLRHSLYWLVFTIIVSLSWIYWFGTFEEAQKVVVKNGFPQYVPITYLFLYFVLPSLLRGQHQSFAFRLAIWCVASLIYRFLLGHYVLFIVQYQTSFINNELRQLFDTGFMLTNNFVFVAASLKMFRYWYRKEQANQQLARETLFVELQVLKAQVHPHFLFNTLNNIYSLTLRQSDRAPEVVQKLSGLLRYMFTECNTPDVLLTKEIELIRNYTELEQLRYGNRLNISLTIRGELAGKQVAPLLLIPFVENAFKHGASEQTDQAFIQLALSVTGNTLIFSIVNSKNVETVRPTNTPGGLGLSNVRKRLALIYPDRHQLTIRAEATRYLVELTIQLSKVPAMIVVEPPTRLRSGHRSPNFVS